MKLTKKQWIGIGVGSAIFLMAFGLALAQQLFQVSRTVPADLEVFDTTVLPDGQLILERRNGMPVEGLGFRKFNIQPPLRQFNEGEAATARIFVTNDTNPPIRLFLSAPCHPAVDANSGQEIGFFFADLHGGNIWWDEQEGRWRDDEIEWAGNTCAPGNERPDGMQHVMPGQTFAMDIKLKFGEAYQNIDPQTINLEPVVIGGVGREGPPQRQIHGRKIWDQDGNGQWDAGEPFLPGWVISLDLDGDGGPDMVTKTDQEGFYWFMNVPERLFTIWEEGQPGWVQTWPRDATGDATNYSDHLGRNEVAEGFDFANQLVAAEIHGRKFNDRNNNGEWDDGEEGLPGWEIAIDLDQDGTADRITTTNRGGGYWFMDLPGGSFDIWEVLQPGWVQTYPAGGIHSGTIQIGEILEFDFGNYLTAAEIRGRKFRDLNGNGAWEEGEPFLPRWNIFLDLNNDGTADMTTMTNEFGGYWFIDLPAGPFHVWEENRPGWVQTRPADPAGYEGELAVGDIVRGLVFGNHLEAAEIHGAKYNDLNNSGGWDEGEPFLEGWEIALDLNNDGTADMTTMTNEFGAYWFMDLPSGPFALWEVVKDGWAVTEPASGVYTGDLNVGDILRRMLFGNYSALSDLEATKVYLTDSNSGFPIAFWEYDVASDTWSRKANLPASNHTQLASDGAHAYVLTTDGKILRYDPGTDTWVYVMDGPAASVGNNSISMFETLNGEFYWAKDSTSTLHYTADGAWASAVSPRPLSAGSAIDRSTGTIYIRTYFQLGFTGFDTSNATFPVICDDATNVLENSRVGAFFDGWFYSRTQNGTYARFDVTSCVKEDTGVSPSSGHSATAEDPAGHIYSNGYSGTFHIFEVYDAVTNTIVRLEDAPALEGSGEHSTLVATGFAGNVVTGSVGPSPSVKVEVQSSGGASGTPTSSNR